MQRCSRFLLYLILIQRLVPKWLLYDDILNLRGASSWFLDRSVADEITGRSERTIIGLPYYAEHLHSLVDQYSALDRVGEVTFESNLVTSYKLLAPCNWKFRYIAVTSSFEFQRTNTEKMLPFDDRNLFITSGEMRQKAKIL